MSAIPYEQSQEEQWTSREDDQAFALPGRRRRRFFNRKSAALMAVITAAAGFYAGVRVEKAKTLSSTNASVSLPAAARTGATSSTAARSGGFPGAGAFGGENTSIGTVKSVDGNMIYVTDASGNTVKVELNSATKITKSLGVSRRSVRPGDSVVVQGAGSSKGRITATSLSDSGSSGTSTTSSTSSAGSSSSGSTATGAPGGGTIGAPFIPGGGPG
jgi:hypothetical protein